MNWSYCETLGSALSLRNMIGFFNDMSMDLSGLEGGVYTFI